MAVEPSSAALVASQRQSQARASRTSHSPASRLGSTQVPGLVAALQKLSMEPQEDPLKFLLSELQKPVLQSAFVFTKPHANTSEVRELVAKKFADMGIEIVTEGDMDGPTIDTKKHIDQHYYAIASKATLLKPSELNVPKEKFKAQFDEEWDGMLTPRLAVGAGLLLTLSAAPSWQRRSRAASSSTRWTRASTWASTCPRSTARGSPRRMPRSSSSWAAASTAGSSKWRARTRST